MPSPFPGMDPYVEATVRDPLPTVPIPLKVEDGTVPLDLSPAFAETYDHDRYARLLRYGRPLSAGFSGPDREWAQAIKPG